MGTTNGTATSRRPAELLAEAAYAQLSEEILRKELPPGASLSVPALARQLGISRSPVREAVQRLIYDGLADYRGRRGTVVSSIQISDFVSLLEVREPLEGLAARLAAQRGTKQDRQRLYELHERFQTMQHGQDRSETDVVGLDVEFHRLIREMSGNDELATILARTQARAHLSMHSLWTGPRNANAAHREHAEICAAILTQDPDRAEAAATAHITGLRHRVLAEVGLR